IYREPLILFYREHQSIETVAAELELSEDAVKQRLSRGRKLLQQEVLAFVEGALERTNPGKAFTLEVLAAVPVLSMAAKAATLGAAVKVGAAAKGATVVGLSGTILSSLLGFLGPWFQYRVLLAAAKSDEERRAIRAFYRRLLSTMVGFAVLLIGLIIFGQKFVATHPVVFASALIGLVTAYVAAAARMGAWA